VALSLQFLQPLHSIQRLHQKAIELRHQEQQCFALTDRKSSLQFRRRFH
jgi:hypothetical protein